MRIRNPNRTTSDRSARRPLAGPVKCCFLRIPPHPKVKSLIPVGNVRSWELRRAGKPPPVSLKTVQTPSPVHGPIKDSRLYLYNLEKEFETPVLNQVCEGRARPHHD